MEEPTGREVLRTPRLLLREMSLADLDFVASMLADPAVMRFYPRLYSREEAEEWVRRQMRRYRSHGYGLWLVEERGGGAPVGQVGLIPQMVDGAEEAEIAYLIASEHWRRGYASEAAGAVRDLALRALGKRRVISLIRAENLPSRGVASKIGMRPAGTALHAGMEHTIFTMSRRDRLGQEQVEGASARPGQRKAGA